MLVITDKQLQQLAEAGDAAFLSEAAALLTRHWPRRVERMGPAALEARLRLVYQRALDLGIRERSVLLRLANMGMALDDDLAADSPLIWVQEALQNPRLRPSDRLDVLDRQVREWLLDERARG